MGSTLGLLGASGMRVYHVKTACLLLHPGEGRGQGWKRVEVVHAEAPCPLVTDGVAKGEACPSREQPVSARAFLTQCYHRHQNTDHCMPCTSLGTSHVSLLSLHVSFLSPSGGTSQHKWLPGLRLTEGREA